MTQTPRLAGFPEHTLAVRPAPRTLDFASLAALPAWKKEQLWESLALEERMSLLFEHWPFWARKSQLPPPGLWKTWLFLGGRGAGKTRAAAEWVRKQMETQQCANMALIGPTFADVRDVMVEGESGLIKIASRNYRPRYEASRRRLVWPNNATALLFSAVIEIAQIGDGGRLGLMLNQTLKVCPL